MAGFLGTVKNRQGVIAAAAVAAVCALAAGAGWYVYGPSLSPPLPAAGSAPSGPAPVARNDAQRHGDAFQGHERKRSRSCSRDGRLCRATRHGLGGKRECGS